MELHFIVEGIIIGLAIEAPIWPISVLCIRRSLVKNPLSGILTWLGSSTSDVFYWLIAGFWLTLLPRFFVDNQWWFQSIGILFLFYLGIKTFFEKPKEEKAEKIKRKGLLSDYLSTFVLSIINPMTIFFFAAIFAGIGVSNKSIPSTILGIFIGSVLWWIMLSNSVGVFRKKINNQVFKWINRISGIIIIIFAIIIIANLIL